MRARSINCLRASSGRPDFPPPSPQVGHIYHIYRRLAAFITFIAGWPHLSRPWQCICIISALTHQICQLGKPWAAAVVRKTKQITLGLTPKHQHTLHMKKHQGISTLCHQGTTAQSVHTKLPLSYCISLFCTSHVLQ